MTTEVQISKEEADLTRLLLAMGYDEGLVAKGLRYINLGRMGLGAGASITSIGVDAFTGASIPLLVNGGAILSAAGTIIGPLAGAASLGRIWATGDRMLGYAARAYTMREWVFYENYQKPNEPLAYFEREVIRAKDWALGITPKRRFDELVNIWESNVKGTEQAMEGNLATVVSQYRQKCQSDGVEPRSHAEVKRDYQAMLKSQNGGKEQGGEVAFLNSIWGIILQQAPESGNTKEVQKTLVPDSHRYPNFRAGIYDPYASSNKLEEISKSF